MQVGSLVVCVKSDLDNYPHHKPLVLKKIYTIRGMFKDDGEVGLLLEEIVNIQHPKGGEIGYNIKRFRELDTPVSINIEELIYEKV
ncbi:hypothetical protein D3C72_2378030 [compost metagenome]